MSEIFLISLLYSINLKTDLLENWHLKILYYTLLLSQLQAKKLFFKVKVHYHNTGNLSTECEHFFIQVFRRAEPAYIYIVLHILKCIKLLDHNYIPGNNTHSANIIL